MTYSLYLTEDDVEVIASFGEDEHWAMALGDFKAGLTRIEEEEAWKLIHVFFEDTTHGLFSSLNSDTLLYAKLITLVHSLLPG